jgi:hypothetical protein
LAIQQQMVVENRKEAIGGEMSDCNVCIGTSDYEHASFYEQETRMARKPHKCCECREEIPRGTSYEHVVGKWDGDFSTYKTCASCVAIRTAFTCGEGWMFKSLWDDMREIAFPELTTASKCLRDLSPADRTRVILKWQQWKGLAPSQEPS